jgi:AcrR family transcriptional regulator
MAKISKESKKINIINVSLALFSKNGFYSTTIPDIAKAVGMSVGNFYNYFKSKDILAKELIIYISEYIGKNIREINEEKISTREKIRKIVKMYFDMAKEHPEMIEYF